jgi:hypothetical protein
VISDGKTSTARSTLRQAMRHSRARLVRTSTLAAAIADLLALIATPASASLARSHGGPFGAFTGSAPRTLAIDQSNCDLCVISVSTDEVPRFDFSGVAKSFAAGSTASTNALSGLNFENFSVLAQGFFSTAEPLRSLNGLGTPSGSFGEVCGTAVDQSNGDAGSIATDLSIGDPYADEGAKVAVLSSAGVPKYSFDSGDLASTSAGVAVNAYVADPTNHQVDAHELFSASPSIVKPNTVTDANTIRATRTAYHSRMSTYTSSRPQCAADGTRR